MSIINNELLVMDGKQLESYIETETNGIRQKRDFVSKLETYIHGNYHRGVIITGLRSTGKTIGVLQSIKGQNALFISPITRINRIKEDDILEIIRNTTSNIIIIDEFSWINGSRDGLANYLAGLAKTGKKIIVSGTDSAIINGLLNSEFIHRAIEIHTTFFPYDEFLRVYGLEKNSETMKSYLETGGIFEEHVHDSFGSMRDYIKNAIIDNLASYYPEYNESEIKAALYTIFYDCVCNLFNREQIPIYSYERSILSYEEYLENFGIDPSQKLNDIILKEVARKLEEIDVVVTLSDLRIKSHQRSYLTNQAISYQMTKCIYNLDSLDDRYIGHLFEASVVCREYMKYIKEPEHSLYEMSFLFGRKMREDFELDFILSDKDKAFIFECKYSDEDNFKLRDGASIVKEIIPNLMGDREVAGRFVIYQGKDKMEQSNGINVIYTNNWDIEFERFQQIIKNFNNIHPKFIALCGLPGSGKSQKAQELEKSISNSEIVSLSQVRAVSEMFDDITDTDIVLKNVETKIKELLKSGKTVIYDATNIIPEHRIHWLTLAQENGAIDNSIIIMKADVETSLVNCIEHGNSISYEKIKSLNNTLNQNFPDEKEGWNHIQTEQVKKRKLTNEQKRLLNISQTQECEHTY